MHARPVRPTSAPVDRRRVVAAALSSALPGLGQAANRRNGLAILFAGPALLLLAVAWLVLQATSTTRLLATLILPSVLTAVLVLNVLVAVWRLVAVGQAFFDRRFQGKPSGRSLAGLVLVVAFVVVPHAYAGWLGLRAFDTFATVFEGGPKDAPASPGPPAGQRLNVLLMGVDSGPNRAHALTDSLIVASLDPVGKTVSMVSIPRDLVDVPLGNGDRFAPKINSLLSYAENHPAELPGGGPKAVESAIGALLGIEIHYYAMVDLGGFVKMVNAVGGVDVTVKRALNDPVYGGYGVGPGWSITRGRHHLDGANALAYSRVRKSAGETDFTRAERQQEVLVGIRDSAVKGNILFQLPALIAAVGDTVRTDLPRERLPELAALAEEIGGKDTTRVVLGHPLVRPASNRFGSVQEPDLVAIRAVATKLFTTPGTAPVPWPTPRPSRSPKPSPTG